MERNDIEKVLRATGKYPIRPPTDVIVHYRNSRPDRYATTGLVNEQGLTWHNLRINLTSELTSPKVVAAFQKEVELIAEDWCNLLKYYADDKGCVDIKVLSERLGLEATCTLVLGRRMGFLLPDGASVTSQNLAEAVHHHFLASRDTFYGLPIWKLIPTSSYKRLIKSEDEIYNLALELIKTADDATQESPVFQSVLRASVDEKEKTATLVDFIAAGIYTLGNSLVFLLHLVGSNPDVQKKLLENLSQGSSDYLKACVNEAFRLLPTAFCLARVSEQDLQLSGHQIKAGTVFLCHTGLACRDERNFKEPCSFRPERWLGAEKTETMAAATFLVSPFGVGRRICPGRRFVEQTLGCILASMVQQLVFESTSTLEQQFEFILAPKGPVPIRLQNRQ